MKTTCSVKTAFICTCHVDVVCDACVFSFPWGQGVQMVLYDPILFLASA